MGLQWSFNSFWTRTSKPPFVITFVRVFVSPIFLKKRCWFDTKNEPLILSFVFFQNKTKPNLTRPFLKNCGWLFLEVFMLVIFFHREQTTLKANHHLVFFLIEKEDQWFVKHLSPLCKEVTCLFKIWWTVSVPYDHICLWEGNCLKSI